MTDLTEILSRHLANAKPSARQLHKQRVAKAQRNAKIAKRWPTTIEELRVIYQEHLRKNAQHDQQTI